MKAADHDKAVEIIRKRVNPSVQNLVGELLDYQNRISVLKTRMANDEEKMAVLTGCEEKLRNIELAIKGRKIFTAWELLHRVGEELVPLMEPAELLAQGQKTIHDVKMSSIPEAQKNDWITKLSESLKKLAEAVPPGDAAQAKSTAQLIKTTMNLVNDQVDAGFWDIWAKKFIAFIYLALLLILVFASFNVWHANNCFSLTHVILLGAIGGLISGIVTGEREDLPKGHFWVPTLYYALVRPTLGAIAAIVMFWMLESQFLIKIDSPLPGVKAPFSCVTSASTAKMDKAETTVADKKDPGKNTQAQNSSAKNPPPSSSAKTPTSSSSVVTFSAVKGKEIYLYMILLLFAGFSGDKLLKSVADKVTAKLFNQVEKTKESNSK